jgi:hypothetical protein
MNRAILILGFLLLTGNAWAVEYHCFATSAVDSSGEWSKERIDKWVPSAIIKHYGRSSLKPSTISRCSYSQIEGKITCDTYPIDHYETTAVANASMFIDKFYYYRGQVDVQIYLNTGEKVSEYIENNGRGTIYWGKCKQPK